MDSGDIKSGSEVISEFLDSLHGDEVIDADILTAVYDLFKTGKLSRIRLLGTLEALRAGANTQRNDSVSEEDAWGDD